MNNDLAVSELEYLDNANLPINQLMMKNKYGSNESVTSLKLNNNQTERILETFN